MKKIFLATIVLLLSLASYQSKATAAEPYLLFWYPGEAGSTTEAKPMIDLFIEKINEKISPEKIRGVYINSTAEGLSFISKEKPVLAIVSFAAWKQLPNTIKTDVKLSTLPLPSGKNRENYTLVGASNTPSKAIYSSEPLSIQFVSSELFSNIPAGAKITSTNQILSELKKIGEKSSTASAILTPSEAFTLSKVSFPWAKNIITIETSKNVPSARVISFDGQSALTDKIVKAFIDFGKTDEEKEILNELRLKGFSTEK